MAGERRNKVGIALHAEAPFLPLLLARRPADRSCIAPRNFRSGGGNGMRDSLAE